MKKCLEVTKVLLIQGQRLLTKGVNRFFCVRYSGWFPLAFQYLPIPGHKFLCSATGTALPAFPYWARVGSMIPHLTHIAPMIPHWPTWDHDPTLGPYGSNDLIWGLYRPYMGPI